MKKLSELSTLELIAIRGYVNENSENEDLSVEESFEILEKLDLITAEIDKRLGEIDFNS